MNKDELKENNVLKCEQWLETCILSEDNSSECSSSNQQSCCGTSTGNSSDFSINESDLVTITNSPLISKKLASQQVISTNTNAYENIIIKNSKKVHLGNVTVINGPIYVKKSQHKDGQDFDESEQANKTWPEDRCHAEANVRFVDRRAWLSQPPAAEYHFIGKPAKFVIICHSATEDSTSHSENILLVRYIQQFHMESRKWDDIGYNFLIGNDGYIYKGRGWGVVGSHTFKYNFISVGLCFVGTFIRKLPPQIALEQAKSLIRYGVAQGEIDPDYILIGNCQASSSKSPGAALFEEIKTWDRFDNTISLVNPSPLIAHIQE